MRSIQLTSGGRVVFVERFYPPAVALAHFDAIAAETPWESKILRIAGREVREPRLTAWFGDVDAVYRYSGLLREPLPWSPRLLELRADAERFAGQSFNSVLLNYYRDQNDSMGFHADKERELGINPTIVSLSFGASRRFILRHAKRNRGVDDLEFQLENGSALLMDGTTQHHWKHAVPKSRAAIGPRINLTFRAVRG